MLEEKLYRKEDQNRLDEIPTPQSLSIPPSPEFSLQNNDEIIAQLKDEIQILRKRLESELIQRPVKNTSTEEFERRIKESKEKNRQLILEKQDLQNELEDVMERYGIHFLSDLNSRKVDFVLSDNSLLLRC